MQILRCLLVARLHAQNFNQMFTAQMFSQETFSQTCVLLTISFLYDYVQTTETHCVLSSSQTYTKLSASYGSYTAMVRAITPVGNGSWSNAVSFEIPEIIEPPSKLNSEPHILPTSCFMGVSDKIEYTFNLAKVDGTEKHIQSWPYFL